MKFSSTRNAQCRVDAAQAIVQGISPEGGLFVPESFPQIPLEEICGFAAAPGGYAACSARVMGAYLTDFTAEELQTMTCEAYASFDADEVTPTHQLDAKEAVLELYHGPTLAFKDVALQMLPRLMSAAIQKTGETRKVLILVATSGDTGKAALEGFRDVPGTSVMVFYPQSGVSAMQQLQMATQQGKNVAVCAVRGNFDDAQSGVKEIFTDAAFAKQLDAAGYKLSSANSINWGRLVPQIAYYFWAYSQQVQKGALKAGAPVDFVVPTGNFGDILAGYYAKKMGLPVGKLLCASNSNNVLTDFFRTGVYDKRRPFHKTASPSMDILISSNLERLLFEACGRDSAQVARWMEQLRTEGCYQVGEEVLRVISEDFSAGWCTEEEGAAAIRALYENDRYLIDTHTANAQAVCEREPSNNQRVVLSTASPYKFPADVLRAIRPGAAVPEDSFAAVELLAAVQAEALGCAPEECVPGPIRTLRTLPVLHRQSCEKDAMRQAVLDALERWDG